MTRETENAPEKQAGSAAGEHANDFTTSDYWKLSEEAHKLELELQGETLFVEGWASVSIEEQTKEEIEGLTSEQKTLKTKAEKVITLYKTALEKLENKGPLSKVELKIQDQITYDLIHFYKDRGAPSKDETGSRMFFRDQLGTLCHEILRRNPEDPDIKQKSEEIDQFPQELGVFFPNEIKRVNLKPSNTFFNAAGGGNRRAVFQIVVLKAHDALLRAHHHLTLRDINHKNQLCKALKNLIEKRALKHLEPDAYQRSRGDQSTGLDEWFDLPLTITDDNLTTILADCPPDMQSYIRYSLGVDALQHELHLRRKLHQPFRLDRSEFHPREKYQVSGSGPPKVRPILDYLELEEVIRILVDRKGHWPKYSEERATDENHPADEEHAAEEREADADVESLMTQEERYACLADIALDPETLARYKTGSFLFSDPEALTPESFLFTEALAVSLVETLTDAADYYVSLAGKHRYSKAPKYAGDEDMRESKAQGALATSQCVYEFIADLYIEHPTGKMTEAFFIAGHTALKTLVDDAISKQDSAKINKYFIPFLKTHLVKHGHVTFPQVLEMSVPELLEKADSIRDAHTLAVSEQKRLEETDATAHAETEEMGKGPKRKAEGKEKREDRKKKEREVKKKRVSEGFKGLTNAELSARYEEYKSLTQGPDIKELKEYEKTAPPPYISRDALVKRYDDLVTEAKTRIEQAGGTVDITATQEELNGISALLLRELESSEKGISKKRITAAEVKVLQHSGGEKAEPYQQHRKHLLEKVQERRLISKMEYLVIDVDEKIASRELAVTDDNSIDDSHLRNVEDHLGNLVEKFVAASGLPVEKAKALVAPLQKKARSHIRVERTFQNALSDIISSKPQATVEGDEASKGSRTANVGLFNHPYGTAKTAAPALETDDPVLAEGQNRTKMIREINDSILTAWGGNTINHNIGKFPGRNLPELLALGEKLHQDLSRVITEFRSSKEADDQPLHPFIDKALTWIEAAYHSKIDSAVKRKEKNILQSCVTEAVGELNLDFTKAEDYKADPTFETPSFNYLVREKIQDILIEKYDIDQSTAEDYIVRTDVHEMVKEAVNITKQAVENVGTGRVKLKSTEAAPTASESDPDMDSAVQDVLHEMEHILSSSRSSTPDDIQKYLYGDESTNATIDKAIIEKAIIKKLKAEKPEVSPEETPKIDTPEPSGPSFS